MKIGILTFHFSDNYGALLQAYALRRYLTDQGHDVFFVNYHPSYVEDGSDFVGIKSFASLKTNLKIAYLKTLKLINACFPKEHTHRMEEFRSKFLPVDGQSIKLVTDIPKQLQSYDLLLFGSDQIWNPNPSIGFDPVYFANFDSKGAVTASYAASFGKNSLETTYNKELGELLSNFDFLSVRERSGAEIIKTANEKYKPVVVPDPTFLLDDYDDLLTVNKVGSHGHVFCYALRSPVGIREVAHGLAKEYGVKVLSPYNPHRRWFEIGETIYPDVIEWLHYLKNAEFVVTNSFHATVFAILFRKKFVFVELSGSRSQLNTRSRNLLDSLGLSSRIVDSDDWEKNIGI